MKKVDGAIYLTPKEREDLGVGCKCPNCKGETFKTVLAEREASKKNPLGAFAKGQPIIQCVNCGFWSNLFDGWVWRSGEVLRK